MDPDLTLTGLSSLKASFEWSGDRTDRAHSEMGKYAAVAPIFAFVALLLAASGLYAVVAHSVVQRTKEIGIRMAVGATASEVRHLVMRQELLPAALGLVVGLIVSLGVNRVLRSQLVGVSPYDPVTLAATAVILTVAALLACRIPLRRAVSVDPAIVLRSD